MNLHDIMIEAGRVKTSEEADDAIAKMLSPTSRAAMSPIYEKVMGYDPTSYFTKAEMNTMICNLISENPEIKSYMRNNEISQESILKLALHFYETSRPRIEALCIKRAFEVECQGMPDDLKDILIDFGNMYAQDDYEDESEEFSYEDEDDDVDDVDVF